VNPNLLKRYLEKHKKGEWIVEAGCADVVVVIVLISVVPVGREDKREVSIHNIFACLGLGEINIFTDTPDIHLFKQLMNENSLNDWNEKHCLSGNIKW
jgi:hypothetical protein